MRLIQKEIGLEDVISRIPSLFPYIDFDIYGDSPMYNDVNAEEGLGVLHLATDGEQGSYGHVMGSFTMPNDVDFGLYGNAEMYYPVTYKDSANNIIPSREYNELSLFGRDCYVPCKYKSNDGRNVIGADEYNGLENNCVKYAYLPSEYQNIYIDDDKIDVSIYRDKTRQSKYNYKAIECSNNERTIKLDDGYNVIDIGDYKSVLFLATRDNGEILVSSEITSNLENYEVYAVSLKKLIIKGGETYSYRSIMNAYYAHYKDRLQCNYKNLSYYVPGNEELYVDEKQFVNKKNKADVIFYIDYHNLETEKQSFIKFIEQGIGRYTIEECVDAYNNAEQETTMPPIFELKNDNGIRYDEFIDSGFYEIDEVYECTKYVKITDNGSNKYLYVNNIDGRLITPSTYNELNLYGRISYEPYKYELIEGSGNLITSTTYDELPFYGKNDYIEYQYINAKLLNEEEYNALSADVKEEYSAYTYVNINDEKDIIPRSTYDSLKKNKSFASEYKVYQYIKNDVTIILNYEYQNLTDSAKAIYVVFSYTNTSKDDDIISVEDYNALPEHGKLDYTVAQFKNEGNGSIIYADEYVEMDDYGKDNYYSDGYYYDSNDVIGNDAYVEMGRPQAYQPFVYEPKSRVKVINGQQYDALPKYGFSAYIPYQYYANINISGDNDPVYEEIIISAEQYDNEAYWDGDTAVGSKAEYSPYSYVPSEIGEDEELSDHLVLFDDYDEMPYFGQNDYNLIPGQSEHNEINFEEDYKNLFKDDEGNPIHEGLMNICPSLINGVIYLSQIDGVLYEMKKLKKSYELLANTGMENTEEIRCEYSKYLRMGGDNMVLLLEWLKQKADEVASEMMTYAKIENNLMMSLPLTLTLQDNGYYTPAMNYKEIGMTVFKGELFTYVDENGIADTYLYSGNEEKTTFSIGAEGISRVKDGFISSSSVPLTLLGKINSKLKTLKCRRTYINYIGQPETPEMGEDWLWYYVKGAIYDISKTTDDEGNILPISDSNALDNESLLVYGSVLTNIEADNDTCTLTFTYYTDAHLKLVKNGDDEQYFEIDLDSSNGRYHGVKYVDTYNYERYGDLYDLVERGGFEEYINNSQRGIEKYVFHSPYNNVQQTIADSKTLNVPFNSSDFEYTFDYNENIKNELFNNVYKEDLLNGIHFKPVIQSDAFILRGTNAAFERHLRLGEVKSLEDLENYHNGSFFNIIDNF